MQVAPNDQDRERLRAEWRDSMELQRLYPGDRHARGEDVYCAAILNADRAGICGGSDQAYEAQAEERARLERLRAGDHSAPSAPTRDDRPCLLSEAADLMFTTFAALAPDDGRGLGAHFERARAAFEAIGVQVLGTGRDGLYRWSRSAVARAGRDHAKRERFLAAMDVA